jgi:hypothetical protein|tara:strand:- start:492 stop:644 length:153 start_codon:yes stop_codon:yes gene_type:complete
MAAEQITIAITMNGNPPSNPANPVEIEYDNPPMKVTKIAVPMKPINNLIL